MVYGKAIFYISDEIAKENIFLVSLIYEKNPIISLWQLCQCFTTVPANDYLIRYVHFLKGSNILKSIWIIIGNIY